VFTGIAIDFDGVLVDSQPLHQAAWESVLRRRKLLVPDLAERILGRSALEFARSIAESEADALHLAQAKESLVSDLATKEPPPLYPTVGPALRVLAEEYRLAIVSSAASALIYAVLSAHKIDSYFEVVVTGDKTDSSRSPYRACLARLSLPALSVVAVEDTPLGIASAKACGLCVVALSNTRPAAALLEADIVIREFAALPATLYKLGVACLTSA
jgi:HAD superfamily hydrolase (TIGR01509 family)